MFTNTDCKQNLIETLKKLIDRNNDIDKSKYSGIELELADVRFGSGCIAFVNNERFNINFFTTIQTAKYVYDNIENVTYIQIEGYHTDTLVGYIPEFITEEFGFEDGSNNYFIAIQVYNQFIRNTNITPKLESVTEHIKEYFK